MGSLNEIRGGEVPLVFRSSLFRKLVRCAEGDVLECDKLSVERTGESQDRKG